MGWQKWPPDRSVFKMQAESGKPAEPATVMTSSGQRQSEICSERATANARHVETEIRCTYPSERRERNQVYMLLNISHSASEEEEKSLESFNGTGWEEAVQGWNKTAPFSYLQLQKRARKPKTSESVSGCLYCLDLLQVVDKSLEQEPKNLNQLKSEFGLNTCSATDSNPEKQQILLCSNAAAPAVQNSPVTEDMKKEICYSKPYLISTSQGEKKKMTLREAQAALSEKKFLLMKESPLFQEKKTVPIKEYNILPPEKTKLLETLKCKDPKSHEPSVCLQTASDAAAFKPSLILPPLSETALKNSLDSSAKKSKTVIQQANAVSDTVPCLHLFKAKEEKCEKRLGTEYSAVKEQAKMNGITSYVPMLSKTSLISKSLDQCYWHCAVSPDRKITAMSNSIALRRHNHLKTMHCLHAKGMQINKANEIQDPWARSRSHPGPKAGNQSKTQEIPLLSGLFPSLTERGWGRATPFACCKIQRRPKKPKITKTASTSSYQNMVSALKKNAAWLSQVAKDQPETDHKYLGGGTISSHSKTGLSCLKPCNDDTVTTINAEGERMKGRLDSIQTFLGEKRTLPIKEYEIKYSQPQAGAKALRCKEISLPKVTNHGSRKNLSCITLNAFLVFRPGEGGAINLHLEPPSKGGGVPSAEKKAMPPPGMISYGHEAKKGNQKTEKKVGINNIVKKEIQNPCTTL